MGLLAKDPLARPASAGDVAAAARALREAPDSPATATLATAVLPPIAAAATTSGEAAPAAGRPRWSNDAYPGQRRTRGLLLLVGLAVVVVGALLLVLVGGGRRGNSAGAPSQPPSGRPSTTSPAVVPTVAVVEEQYTGRQFADVQRDLTALGLTVRRSDQASGATPDTVIAVAPNGQVPAHGTVTVTVATAKHGKHHGQGEGNND